MYTYPIEQIHEWLDSLETELENIKLFERSPDDTLLLSYYPTLCSIISDLHWDEQDWQTGISRTLINKFRRGDGHVRVREALPVAERIRTYLRSLDQQFADNSNEQSKPEREPPNKTVGNQIPPLSAERWTYVEHRAEIKSKLLDIAQAIDEVLTLAANPNLPPDMAALTEIERSQLIAILETALAVVKSPMVETGLLKRLQKRSKEIAARTAEKKAEEGLGAVLNTLSDYLLDLLSRLG